MIKPTIICLLLKFILLTTCTANDTIKLVKPILLDKIGREYAPGYLLIDYKDFQIGYTQNNGFFNHLSYSNDKYSQVYFRNSGFGVYETSEIVVAQPTKSGFYILDSCTINHLPIENISGNVTITSSQMNFLTVNKTSDLSLTLSRDSSISFVSLSDNRNMKLHLNQCKFTDSAEMRIINSNLSEFSFEYNKLSGCNIFFSNDTINQFYGTVSSEDEKELENYKKWYKYQNVFTFNNCHINADFIFFEKIPNSTIIFNRCTFGPNISLSDLAIDRLIIRNCINIQEQISIGFREQEKEVELSLTNSNLDNIRFDFTHNIKLIFDSNHSKDVVGNSYKSLLEKYEHEGKGRSYMYVDLQYRKHSQNKILHFINCIWWYHGYMPSLVFIWTIVLLLSFFALNLSFWKQIHETYPIVEGQRADSFNRKNQKGRFYLTVLLYTILIFFSLRVNFDKLKFKRLGFVYILLGEYLVGLCCLLFILRFILKL